MANDGNVPGFFQLMAKFNDVAITTVGSSETQDADTDGVRLKF